MPVRCTYLCHIVGSLTQVWLTVYTNYRFRDTPRMASRALDWIRTNTLRNKARIRRCTIANNVNGTSCRLEAFVVARKWYRKLAVRGIYSGRYICMVPYTAQTYLVMATLYP